MIGTCDSPLIELALERIDGAELVVKVAVDRHVFAQFPSLHGTDIALEVRGDFLPRIETFVHGGSPQSTALHRIPAPDLAVFTGPPDTEAHDDSTASLGCATADQVTALVAGTFPLVMNRNAANVQATTRNRNTGA